MSGDATLSGFHLNQITSRSQGCQSANPGLELANTFGVIVSEHLRVLSILYTRVSSGWRCVIFFRRRPEQFSEDRL